MLRNLLTQFLMVTCLYSFSTNVEAQDKNSMRKVRIKPSEFSGQCGSAVAWRESVEKALQESAESGKPVFWYVPTIKGSFMDRKPVIDQYMMAGPFSWPAIAKLLNDHFVPVKAVVTGDLQRKFENLKRYKFVEPGFLVLNSDGSVKTTIDQITTLDPYWISSLIAGWAGVETPSLWSDGLSTTIHTYRQQFFVEAGTLIDKETTDIPAERILLSGMNEFRLGNHDKAREIWLTAKDVQSDHPLAWKAVAEAENWGPFVRGFEVHRQLPEQAYQAGQTTRGSTVPQGTYSEANLWRLSCQFLIGMQNSAGGWTDSDYDFGGTDSLPNVHVAVSALCGNALLEGHRNSPDTEEKADFLEAVEKAAAYCRDRNNMNFDDSDEILWAHAYRVRFFASLVEYSPEFRQKYAGALAESVDDLQSIQSSRGNWYHEYANSFVTATALTALKCAADTGATVDQQKIKLGVVALANDRYDNGAYPYSAARTTRQRGSRESSGNGQIPASAGRMPLCELGLWQWGGSDDEKLQFALKAAFENHQHLAVGYKYDNHTSTMAYGGFFFWYDMRSRAEALRFMTPGESRSGYAATHRQLVLELPELDGCFVDSHELGRCYGTAMALLTLSILDEIENR